MFEVRYTRHTSSVPGRVLTVTGNLQSLNQLAADARANYIIHTGDFGFYDDKSLERIAEKCVHQNHMIAWPGNADQDLGR